MYEFTREENTQILNTMVNQITFAIARKNEEQVNSIIDFVGKMYEIECVDYEFNVKVKLTITMYLFKTFENLVETGSTYTNASDLMKAIVHDLICNWFREYDIAVYKLR